MSKIRNPQGSCCRKVTNSGSDFILQMWNRSRIILLGKEEVNMSIMYYCSIMLLMTDQFVWTKNSKQKKKEVRCSLPHRYNYHWLTVTWTPRRKSFTPLVTGNIIALVTDNLFRICDITNQVTRSTTPPHDHSASRPIRLTTNLPLVCLTTTASTPPLDLFVSRSLCLSTTPPHDHSASRPLRLTITLPLDHSVSYRLRIDKLKQILRNHFMKLWWMMMIILGRIPLWQCY